MKPKERKNEGDAPWTWTGLVRAAAHTYILALGISGL